MKFLTRLHDRVAPPGLEMVILRRIPALLLAATIAPLLVATAARLLPGNASAAAFAKQTTSIDIFCIAIAVTMWVAILTVAIGSIVVFIMKGPAYGADAYPVPHKDRPDQP